MLSVVMNLLLSSRDGVDWQQENLDLYEMLRRDYQGLFFALNFLKTIGIRFQLSTQHEKILIFIYNTCNYISNAGQIENVVGYKSHNYVQNK